MAFPRERRRGKNYLGSEEDECTLMFLCLRKPRNCNNLKSSMFWNPRSIFFFFRYHLMNSLKHKLDERTSGTCQCVTLLLLPFWATFPGRKESEISRLVALQAFEWLHELLDVGCSKMFQHATVETLNLSRSRNLWFVCCELHICRIRWFCWAENCKQIYQPILDFVQKGSFVKSEPPVQIMKSIVNHGHTTIG